MSVPASPTGGPGAAAVSSAALGRPLTAADVLTAREVAELSRAAAGSDLLEVAAAYGQVADAAHELARAVERADRERGLLPPARARRSA
jgi:hypothetical protein